VFVYLAPGRTGLIPMAETGLSREADLAKTFPLGADVEVEVLEVEPDGRRMRLSRKAVLEAGEREDLREYTQRSEPKQEGAGFGSLADKLRSALKR
ncbi:MAG TPA: S1 RNA-binding domain-containing protein, partial [Candidatus Polarisedimenticolaceae bacterium]|nr:S1 RNA-binding domain-containing protein [Candidatus Polarisedimenticolaceae bacterium]